MANIGKSGSINEKQIRTSLYELTIRDGIIYASYLEKIVVDLEISKQVLKDRTILSEGKAYPIMGDVRNVKYWTKEAKKHHSSEEYGRLITAVALLIDSSILAVLFNFYNRFYTSKFPVKIFSSETEALEWLEQYKES